MLPQLATQKQITEGKTRKPQFETCWTCYPSLCKCPQTPQEVLEKLLDYLREYKNVLTDTEKQFIQHDIEELKSIIAKLE